MEELGAGSSLDIMRPLAGLRSNEHNWPRRKSVNTLAQGSSDSHSGLYPRPNFGELGLLGRSPEPLALILARVGHPHVLTSLHLLQAVLVHFLLGEDEEEDTTGEADGPRDGGDVHRVWAGTGTEPEELEESVQLCHLYKCCGEMSYVYLSFVRSAGGTPRPQPPAAACFRQP